MMNNIHICISLYFAKIKETKYFITEQRCETILHVKIWLCLFYLSCSMCNASTATQLSFNVDDEDIFRQPWQSYQHLLTFQPSFGDMTHEQKLSWLVSKAQCELLLYLNEDFNKTTLQANQLTSQTTPVAIRAQVAYFLGVSWQSLLQYKRAISSLNTAIKLASEHDLNEIYIVSKQHLAFTQSIIEQFDTSLIDIKMAHDKALELNDLYLLSRVHEAYGAVYFYMQHYQKSVEYYTKATDSYQQLAYPAHRAEAIYGLANSYRYWGKFPQAIKYFRLYRQNTGYTPNRDILFYANYGLSMSLAEQGICQQALLEIEKALILNGLPDFNAELYKRKASCLISQNQFIGAKQALTQAEKIYKNLPELQGTAWQLEVIKITSDLAAAQGDLKQRDSLLDDYYQQYANLLISNSSSRVINVRGSMKNARQQIEEALSYQRKKIAEFEKTENDLTQYFFVALVVILSVVMVLVLLVQNNAHKKIRQLSTTDSLSGTSNRSQIMKLLTRQLNKTNANAGNLSIVLLSIDNLKEINKHHGTDMGDIVIKMLAAIGQATLASDSYIGRVNVEQFLCVIPSKNSLQAETIGRHIIANLNQQTLKNAGGELVVANTSAGIVQLTPELYQAQHFFAKAELALARARNLPNVSVVVYAEGM